MKRKPILLGLLSVVVLLLASCSNEEQASVASSADAPQKWKIVGIGSVPEDGETASNRAISMGGSTGIRLYYNWEAGDVVKVYNSSGTYVGTLDVTVDAMNTSKATLEGETSISGEYVAGQKLYYYYVDKAQDFTGQNGTLAYVSGNCNYMKAEVTILEVDAENHVLHMGTAGFGRTEAMAIFKFQDEGGNWLRPERVTITAASGKLITSVDADGTEHYGSLTIDVAQKDGMYPYELFVALKNGNKATPETYSFEVKVGDDIYASTSAASSKYTHSNVYADGQYYAPGAIVLPMKDIDASLTNAINAWGEGEGIDDSVKF